MSMNLDCKQFELQQTPTYITYMCYYKYLPGLPKGTDMAAFSKKFNGKPFRAVKDNWISIREKYIYWLMYQAQSNFNYYPPDWNHLSNEERDEIIKEKEEELDYVYSQIKELRSIPHLDFRII